jgi:hypothetical protein
LNIIVNIILLCSDWNPDFPVNHYQGKLWLGRCEQNTSSVDNLSVKLVKNTFESTNRVKLWFADDITDLRIFFEANELEDKNIINLVVEKHSLRNDINDNDPTTYINMHPVWLGAYPYHHAIYSKDKT